MIENRISRFKSRFGDDANQVINSNLGMDRLVETTNPFGRDFLAAGVRIDNDRVATGNHVDRITSDRWQRVGYRCDRPDDSERSVFDDRQTMVAAENLAFHELDARCFLGEHF